MRRLIARADVFVSNVRARGRWPAPASTMQASAPGQSAADPLLDPGLRPRRPLLQPPGLRSHRPEPVGRRRHARARHRRAALRADGDERPHQRPDRRPMHRLRALSPREDRQGRGDRRADAGEHGLVRVERASRAPRPSIRRSVPTGDDRLLSADYRPLPTKDGYITVAAQHQCARPSPSSTPSAGRSSRPIRASTAPRARTANAAAYFEVRKARPRRRRRPAEWVELFDKLDVPARALQLDRRSADRSASHGCRLLHGQRIIPAKAASGARVLANIFSGGGRGSTDARARAGRAHARGAGRSRLQQAGTSRPCWSPAPR